MVGAGHKHSTTRCTTTYNQRDGAAGCIRAHAIDISSGATGAKRHKCHFLSYLFLNEIICLYKRFIGGDSKLGHNAHCNQRQECQLQSIFCQPGTASGMP